MAAPSKTQILHDVNDLLRKRYKLEARTERFSILEAVVYGICHEGTTREQASEVLARFKSRYYDWNEVRVSAITEIQETLAGLTHVEERARKIRRFLRQLFSKTYGFSLDALMKKPQKDVVKLLREYEAFQSDYVLSTVVQQALGGHSIPVDRALRRVMTRLGVADEKTDDEAIRGVLERAIPKNRGTEFLDQCEELAHDVCVEGEPHCPRCELKKICPTGRARLEGGGKVKKPVVAAAEVAKPAAPRAKAAGKQGPVASKAGAASSSKKPAAAEKPVAKPASKPAPKAAAAPKAASKPVKKAEPARAAAKAEPARKPVAPVKPAAKGGKKAASPPKAARGKGH